MKFCCDAFQKEAGEYKAAVGGGLLYPAEIRPDAQFRQDEDGTWSIMGCCGGGCSVVSEMKFCPFCGADVSKLEN